MRDWTSAIVTVAVRDQRYREHDPLLGVIPLKLSDIFKTTSQVTRWYPLDGGIGFGRVRISLLFRQVETKLPPNMLGWDVGTFEFTSDKITAENYAHHAKIKLRTGGSNGKIPRQVSHTDGNNTVFDLSDQTLRKSIRLPVKHRYRSPIVFEFHTAGKRGAAAYAVLWLQHLVDSEDTAIDIPIWTTKKGGRLTQNYITERNWKAKEVPGLEDLTEVGRLKLRARFSPGIDESHEHFIVDNDSRETYETWEACLSEGVRQQTVSSEVPEEIQELHDKSLDIGREFLKQSDPAERKRWIDKQGQDWSGAFGDDPRAYTDSKGRKVAEPGRDRPRHDPVNPPPVTGQPSRELGASKADRALDDSEDSESGDSESGESSGAERRALANHHNNKGGGNNKPGNNGGKKGTTPDGIGTGQQDQGNAKTRPINGKDVNKVNKRTEQRQERGMMQWKPARNAVFAKDEGKFALRKMKKKLPGGDLTGREPDIETETGK